MLKRLLKESKKIQMVCRVLPMMPGNQNSTPTQNFMYKVVVKSKERTIHTHRMRTQPCKGCYKNSLVLKFFSVVGKAKSAGWCSIHRYLPPGEMAGAGAGVETTHNRMMCGVQCFHMPC